MLPDSLNSMLLPYLLHSVSLDSVLGDVRSLQRGLELTQREFVRQDDCMVLKEFLRTNSPIMDKLLADSKTAQVGWGWPGLVAGGWVWGWSTCHWSTRWGCVAKTWEGMATGGTSWKMEQE